MRFILSCALRLGSLVDLGRVHLLTGALCPARTGPLGYHLPAESPLPGYTFPQDGRSITTETASHAAMTRLPRTQDGHAPASGWRLRAPASTLPRLF